jgi:hypothetical protein
MSAWGWPGLRWTGTTLAMMSGADDISVVIHIPGVIYSILCPVLISGSFLDN